MDSIIQAQKSCFLCGTENNLHSHHLYSGLANRKLSEKYGMKIWLCAYHHNLGGKNCVHYNSELNDKIKAHGQKIFKKQYPDEDFIKIFGRNYID